MSSRYLPRPAWFILPFAISLHAQAGQTIFRILAHTNQYGPPGALTEVSRGLFYFFSGSGSAVLGITTKGTPRLIDSLPFSVRPQSPLIPAPNGQFYSSIWSGYVSGYPNPGSALSIGLAPGDINMYGPQTLASALSQNLPTGIFLAIAHNIFTDDGSLAFVDLGGNVTPIYNFSDTDIPLAAAYATDGNYYVFAARNRDGYVARITPSGSSTILASIPNSFFANNGYTATLFQASDGNLYGTTPLGGAHSTGSVYRLTLDGQLTILYSFAAVPNAYPQGLIEGSDGNLYGGTNGYLSPTLLYRLTKSGEYTQLYQMQEDHGCPCALTQGSDGVIYGAAAHGGFIFGLYGGLPKPPPSILQFTPPSGAVGTAVLLWGANLLDASVLFNGVPASQASSRGINYVYAVVPPGATTGPITVTTPGGASTTRTNFKVE